MRHAVIVAFKEASHRCLRSFMDICRLKSDKRFDSNTTARFRKPICSDEVVFAKVLDLELLFSIVRLAFGPPPQDDL